MEEEEVEKKEEETPDVHIEEMHIEPEERTPLQGADHIHADLHERLARCEDTLRELEQRISELHAAIAAKRERGPEDDHVWFRRVGRP